MTNDQVDLAQAGQLLRTLREQRGWSRPRLAKLASVSEATIRNTENAHRADGIRSHPYGHTIRPLAEAFGREDGARLLAAFGYEPLDEDGDGPEPGAPAGVVGVELTEEQEAVIHRIVEGLVELAQSASRPHPVVDLSKYQPRRTNPRYEVSPGANRLRSVA